MRRIVTFALVTVPAMLFLVGDPDQPWLAWIVDRVKAESRRPGKEEAWTASAILDSPEGRTGKELLSAAYSACNRRQAQPYLLRFRQYSQSESGWYVLSVTKQHLGPQRFVVESSLRDRNGTTRVRLVSNGRGCRRETRSCSGVLRRRLVPSSEIPDGPAPLLAAALGRLSNATVQRVKFNNREYLLVMGPWEAEEAGHEAASRTILRVYLDGKSLWPRRLEWLQAEVGGKVRLAFDFYPPESVAASGSEST